jgi:outer membrane lipoprotein LolB
LSQLFLSRRTLAFTGLAASALILSGCANTLTSINKQNQTDVWAGRLSLQIRTEPAQAFFAGFELRGNAQQGELSLTSPIGSTLGVMRWSPGQATLTTGGEIKRYSSTDELLEKSTGAAIPLSALFDWLRGTNTVLSGWTADLSRQPEGRIDATRSSPAPLTQLRIVLNQ